MSVLKNIWRDTWGKIEGESVFVETEARENPEPGEREDISPQKPKQSPIEEAIANLKSKLHQACLHGDFNTNEPVLVLSSAYNEDEDTEEEEEEEEENILLPNYPTSTPVPFNYRAHQKQNEEAILKKKLEKYKKTLKEKNLQNLAWELKKTSDDLATTLKDVFFVKQAQSWFKDQDNKEKYLRVIAVTEEIYARRTFWTKFQDSTLNLLEALAFAAVTFGVAAGLLKLAGPGAFAVKVGHFIAPGATETTIKGVVEGGAAAAGFFAKYRSSDKNNIKNAIKSTLQETEAQLKKEQEARLKKRKAQRS